MKHPSGQRDLGEGEGAEDEVHELRKAPRVRAVRDHVVLAREAAQLHDEVLEVVREGPSRGGARSTPSPSHSPSLHRAAGVSSSSTREQDVHNAAQKSLATNAYPSSRYESYSLTALHSPKCSFRGAERRQTRDNSPFHGRQR